MMTKEIYESVAKRLLSTGVVRWVDLWNHNVEFIDDESGWPRPAVFVEFSPMRWEDTVAGVRWLTEGHLNLHIVTDWKGSTSVLDAGWEKNLEDFDVTEAVIKALSRVDGESFKELTLDTLTVNHNHEGVVETIVGMGYVGILEFSS